VPGANVPFICSGPRVNIPKARKAPLIDVIVVRFPSKGRRGHRADGIPYSGRGILNFDVAVLLSWVFRFLEPQVSCT
jgi:hypothetical protein